MQAAILVIDLINDTFKNGGPLVDQASALLQPLNNFLAEAREDGHRVIFGTDSFLEGDFIFQSRMKPHAIRGTSGSEPYSGLQRDPEDVWLTKRRFSAFFKTDLDQTLRLWNIQNVAVAGMTTQGCVLATALDALSHDFRVVILEDLCASFSQDIHEAVLEIYRNNNVLEPLFKVIKGRDFLSQMKTIQ